MRSGGASVKYGNTVHTLIELSRGVPIYGHYGHYGVLRVTMEILWEHYAGLHSTAHGNYYIQNSCFADGPPCWLTQRL